MAWINVGIPEKRDTKETPYVAQVPYYVTDENGDVVCQPISEDLYDNRVPQDGARLELSNLVKRGLPIQESLIPSQPYLSNIELADHLNSVYSSTLDPSKYEKVESE